MEYLICGLIGFFVLYLAIKIYEWSDSTIITLASVIFIGIPGVCFNEVNI